MNIEIDPDLKQVAEFMQSSITASKLVGVAEALAQLAPTLWGHHGSNSVEALRLVSAPISHSYASHRQEASIE